MKHEAAEDERQIIFADRADDLARSIVPIGTGWRRVSAVRSYS